MKTVVIIGTGGHAKVCIDCLEKMDEYKIIGLIDDFKPKGNQVSGYDILGGIEEIKNITGHYFFIAVGDNSDRYEIYKRLESLNLNYINIIHPSAVVANKFELSNSRGVVVMPGAVINKDSYIGDFTIINTGATLDHDNVLSDFASVAPGVHTGGNVHIGRMSHIGIGATVLNMVTIGEQTIVGAGSVVLNFIEAYKIAYGTPCIEIKDRKKGDKYL